ncbi:MAG: 3'-5' exonuclease, partial [Nitrososphaerota archaeon]|nr:3'-5' exonuclease [Nitrososphaerota archaeon]
LAATGLTREEMLSFPDPEEAHGKLLAVLEAHCDKYDRSDKFVVAGYNVKFDVDFLFQWFKKCGDPYCGSWLNGKRVDPLPVAHWLDYLGVLSLPDYKLVTLARHFGIEFDAHDAMNDIRATRDVMEKVRGLAARAFYDLVAEPAGACECEEARV